MSINSTFPKLQSNSIEFIKWMAIITMIIDHFGVFLFDNNEIMRSVGRAAFPLFSFLLIHNYIYFTSNKINYIKRLWVFAFISQPFYMLLIPHMFNIFFLLAIGLSYIYLLEEITKYPSFLSLFISKDADQILVLGILVTFTYFLIEHVDYGSMGLMLILSMYLLFKRTWLGSIFIVLFFILFYVPNTYIGGILASLIIITSILINFNIKRVNKYIFYLFYPLHFLLIYIIISI